jgi:hypothetical protein
MAIRTVQVTEISFDCSLDDSDWTEKDQLETEEMLPKAYIGQIFEVEVTEDADDAEVAYELCEEVSSASGWCINSIDFRYILSS